MDSEDLHPATFSECATELGGALVGGESSDLSAQRFDLGRAVKAQHSTQLLR